jgi:hypothetical protein
MRARTGTAQPAGRRRALAALLARAKTRLFTAETRRASQRRRGRGEARTGVEAETGFGGGKSGRECTPGVRKNVPLRPFAHALDLSHVALAQPTQL